MIYSLMKNEIKNKIERKINDLPKKKMKLALYLLNNIEEIPFLSIKNIAQKSKTSTATVTRFVREFGFEGFYDFKNQLQEELRNKVNPVDKFGLLDDKLNGEGSLLKVAEQDIKNINRLLTTIDKKILDNFKNNIEKSKRIFTFGVGMSSIFSRIISYLFNQIEVDTHCLDEGSMPPEERIFNLSKDDLLIFSSFKPYSNITIKIAKVAKKRDLKSASITDNKLSPITKYTSIAIPIPSENILFTNSITAFSVLINSIATEIAIKKKYRIIHEIKEKDKVLKDFYF